MQAAGTVERAKFRVESIIRRFFTDPIELAINYSVYLFTLGVAVFLILKVTHWVWDLVSSAW